MRKRCDVILLVALCGWLFLCSSAEAQLTREWSFDWSALGWGTSLSNPVIVDDSGNSYVFSYPGAAFSGARVTKIKTDGTVDWQTDYPDPGLYVDYFGRSFAGDIYVAGHHQIDGGWKVSANGLKFTTAGTLAWDVTVTPVAAPYFGSIMAAVDTDGNLWLGLSERATDSLCVDSFPYQESSTGGSLVMSQAVIYRLAASDGAVDEIDRFDGGTRRPAGIFQIVADNDGYVDVLSYFIDYCCNDLCQNCADSCFTKPQWPGKSIGRQSLYLRRYTNAGGFAGSTWLAASDDPFMSSILFSGRGGELFVKRTLFMSPQPWHTQMSRYGHWTNEFSGEFGGGPHLTTDYSGNLLALVGEGQTTFLYYIDGATGSLRWSKLGSYRNFGADREGNLYAQVPNNDIYKFDEWGNELWQYTPPRTMFRLIHCDTAGFLYYYDADGLSKYYDTKNLVIRDASNDSLPNVEFELIKVRNNPPLFTEDTLGTFTANSRGHLRLDLLPDNKFLFDHDLGADTLAIEDTIKIAKHVHTEQAIKHTTPLPTMYTVHLDNATFDETGAMSFLILDDQSEQEVKLEHTEVRFNLLVGVEWDADKAYLDALQETFRTVSNYLYDVSDGQISLDTVMIYDNRDNFAVADVQIHASNVQWPVAWVDGIRQYAEHPIRLPRMDFAGSIDQLMDSSYLVHPLHFVSDNDVRTKGHEFGHFALGFWDEYDFVDPITGLPLPSTARCGPLPDYNYGFMDQQYFDDDGGEHASEMSSDARYAGPLCRNTKHYFHRSMSCWDYFEQGYEHQYGPDNIPISIIKPGEPERDLPAGLDYFPGPNNNSYLLPPNYDVGGRVRFPRMTTGPAIGTGTLHALVRDPFGQGAGRVEVESINRMGQPGARYIKQGKTSQWGTIYVLGADFLDHIILAGALRVEVDYTAALASVIRETWLCGTASTGSGISKVGNRFQTSLAGDSLEIVLREIADRPAVLRVDANAESVTSFLDVPSPLSQLPTLEIITDSGTVTHTFATVPTGYELEVADDVEQTGITTIWLTDTADSVYFFNAEYVQADVDSSVQLHEFVGGSGMFTLSWDSLGSDTGRLFGISTQYPPIRDGLPSDAVRAGAVYSLSWYPSTLIEGSARLTLRYGDQSMIINNGLGGDESSLQVYRWNDGTRVWEIVGGEVDTADNLITAAITQPGVYAAYTNQIITDVEDEERGEVLPYRFELSQNYPNPFNPVTTIEYSLPERSQVTIEVYNVLGQRVHTLLDQEQSAGSYTITWDGSNSVGNSVSTGVYLYRFQTGNHVETKKMLLLR